MFICFCVISDVLLYQVSCSLGLFARWFFDGICQKKKKKILSGGTGACWIRYARIGMQTLLNGIVICAMQHHSRRSFHSYHSAAPSISSMAQSVVSAKEGGRPKQTLGVLKLFAIMFVSCIGIITHSEKPHKMLFALLETVCCFSPLQYFLYSKRSFESKPVFIFICSSLFSFSVFRRSIRRWRYCRCCRSVNIYSLFCRSAFACSISNGAHDSRTLCISSK